MTDVGRKLSVGPLVLNVSHLAIRDIIGKLQKLTPIAFFTHPYYNSLCKD